MKTLLLATAALLIAAPAFAQTAPAAPAAPAAPEEPTTPRIKGTVNGGPMNTLTYSVACPKVDISQYQAAADELFVAENRAAITKAEGIFNTGQEKFGSYVDCVQTNYNEDRDAMISTLSAALQDSVKAELARIEADMTVIRTAMEERAKAGFKAPKPERRRRGDPEPAPAAAPAAIDVSAAIVDVSRFEGRKIGKLAAGELATAAYTSGCPGVEMPVTKDQVVAIATPDEFNALATKLGGINDQFTAYQECLNNNGNDDLKAADETMLAAINASVRADQQALNTALGELQRVITLKKTDLAAPSRPAPRRR